jgi:hypothetical protein
MNAHDSSGLIKMHMESFVYKDPLKVDGVWCRGIVGIGGILREMTDDLELTEKFTLSEGQGYMARHGLTFARAFCEHELRLKYNKTITKGKRTRTR